ncbi:MAG TPA: NTP transferase domain-containing protein [Pedococcus sp.]|jgi:CTP:molybdopterin cytidylyltransferase MocA
MTTAVGLLLAAGAGTRMGRPKALVAGDDGEPWLRRAARALHDGGCAEVAVVVGAEAGRAADLLTGLPWARAVAAPRWEEGLSASLAAGLAALEATPATAAVVLLVDTPDVGPDVVARVLARSGDGAAALGRAAYGGVPGHPVVLGRDHWAGAAGTATGDRGARDYLAGRPVTVVECGDLATGADVDAR